MSINWHRLFFFKYWIDLKVLLLSKKKRFLVFSIVPIWVYPKCITHVNKRNDSNKHIHSSNREDKMRSALILLLLFLNFVLSSVLAKTPTKPPKGCTILNDCAVLGEKNYTGSALNPEVITYGSQTIKFRNGLTLYGRKLAFALDVNPTLPYLGVWRLPKGANVYLKVENNHLTDPVNVHTHGLHVKGTGSDDPSIDIAPNTVHQYEYQIGRDHRTCFCSFWFVCFLKQILTKTDLTTK